MTSGNRLTWNRLCIDDVAADDVPGDVDVINNLTINLTISFFIWSDVHGSEQL